MSINTTVDELPIIKLDVSFEFQSLNSMYHLKINILVDQSLFHNFLFSVLFPLITILELHSIFGNAYSFTT